MVNKTDQVSVLMESRGWWVTEGRFQKMVVPAQGTSTFHLSVKWVKTSRKAELCGPDFKWERSSEGRAERGELMWSTTSLQMWESAVHWRMGVPEKGVPSVHGDRRRGARVGWKHQQQEHGLISYKGSFNTYSAEHTFCLCRPGLWGACEEYSYRAPTMKGFPSSKEDKAGPWWCHIPASEMSIRDLETTLRELRRRYMSGFLYQFYRITYFYTSTCLYWKYLILKCFLTHFLILS